MINVGSVYELLAFALIANLIMVSVFYITKFILKKFNTKPMLASGIHASMLVIVLGCITQVNGSYAAIVTTLLLIYMVVIYMCIGELFDRYVKLDEK